MGHTNPFTIVRWKFLKRIDFLFSNLKKIIRFNVKNVHYSVARVIRAGLIRYTKMQHLIAFY